MKRVRMRSSIFFCSLSKFSISRISVIFLMICPYLTTSSRSPVIPTTPAISPSSRMGRLIPFRVPSYSSSLWMISSSRCSPITRAAPSW